MGYRYNPFIGDFDRVDTTTVPPTFPNTFVADTGSAIPAAFIINMLGDATQGMITSAAGNTVTFTNDDATETQKGVLETSTDAESIAGTINNVSVVPTSLKAKLGAQTQFGICYGDTDSNALQWTAAGADGQILIAATASAPAFASLTSTGGTITYTPGPNSLNLEAGGSVAITFDADAGSATPVANVINIVGDATQGISSSGAANTITYTIADATTFQKGVSELATNGEAIAGVDNSRTIVSSSLTAKLGVQTGDGIAYGTGTTNAIGWTGGLTDGQLAIGSTAGVPAAGTITSLDSSITVTLGANTIDLATGSSIASSFTTDSGTATPASGIINIAGGTLLNTAGATNVVTINADDNVVGSVGTDSGSVTPSSNNFNIVGSTGIATSGATNTVTLTLDGAIAQSFPTDSGTATPAAGVLTIAGGTGISTSGSGSTVTITNTSTGIAWTEVTVTGPTAMAVNNGYVANNAGSVGLTMPATAAIGDIIRVAGKGAGGWSIGQNAGQTIHFGDQSSTTGAGGSVASTLQYDALEMVCITANTDFVVLSSVGNLTVT